MITSPPESSLLDYVLEYLRVCVFVCVSGMPPILCQRLRAPENRRKTINVHLRDIAARGDHFAFWFLRVLENV